jgi:ribosome biogenesis GTPase / thiamine phosphate phosphatase
LRGEGRGFIRHLVPATIETAAQLQSGRIVAAFSRRYLVENAGGQTVPCMPRGRKVDYACGDRVTYLMSGADQGVIEAADPRSTLFIRSDRYRTKLIAANVTQVVMLVATEPSFSLEFVDRALTAARIQRIPAFVAFNKTDLPGAVEALARLAAYRALNYPVIEFAAKRDIAPLAQRLDGQVNLLLGQSGMGKSTLVNRLVPGAQAATREISQALDSGKHTTTHARLFHIDAATDLIDCPGMQEFGLAHLSFRELEYGFVEIDALLGQCRFANCRHDKEPDCAVRAGVAGGRIAASRYASFRRIATEVQD